MLVKTRADKARPSHLHLKHRAGHVIALSTVSKERDLERIMRLRPQQSFPNEKVIRHPSKLT